MPHKNLAAAKAYFRQRYLERAETIKARSKVRYYAKLAAVRAYNRTFDRVLKAAYRNAVRRVTGRDRAKAHLYAGLHITDWMTFYSWSLAESDFPELFSAWEVAGNSRRLTPTIDRIDSCQGYVLDNMRWLPQWQNSGLGAESRWR